MQTPFASFLLRSYPFADDTGGTNEIMKTTISVSTPAQFESEALVAVVLDHAEKKASAAASDPKTKGNPSKPRLQVEGGDGLIASAAADLLASGELTGKPFESNLLHKPAG